MLGPLVVALVLFVGDYSAKVRWTALILVGVAASEAAIGWANWSW